MNTYKRFFALILSLCMVLSFVPVSAFAAETGAEQQDTASTTVEGTDIMVAGADNADSVAVTVTSADGVDHIHSQTATVAGVGDTYVAYDVVLCTDTEDACTGGFDCTNTYTGAATVSIPLGDTFGENDQLRGFVVNDDGTVSYISEVTRDTTLNTLTFEAPHFSTVGVTLAADEGTGDTGGNNLTVYVGQTMTIEIPYTSDAVTVGDASVATATAKTDGYTLGSEVTAQNSFVTGTYLFVNQNNNKLLTNQAADTGSQLQLVSAEGSIPESAVWSVTLTSGNYLFHVQDAADQYLNIAEGTASMGAAAVLDIWRNGSYWGIRPDGQPYYLTHSDDDVTAAGLNTNPSGNQPGRWSIYQVNADNKHTDLVITGVKAGATTTVTIGDVVYNVTVEDYVENVTLYPDEVKDFTLAGDAFTDADVTNSNSNAASVATSVETVYTNPHIGLPVNGDTFVSGKQYLLVNVSGNYMASNQAGNGNKLAAGGTPGISETNPEYNFWTITKISDGVYTVQDTNGKYLTFGENSSELFDTAVNLNIFFNTTTGYWVIKNENNNNIVYLNNRDNQPGGWDTDSADNDNGSRWCLIPVLYDENSTTTVTITGNNVGDSVVKVGYATYNVTVNPFEKNVNLQTGETVVDTIDGAAYTTADVKEQPDGTVATLDSVVTVLGEGTKELVEITSLDQIVSGRQYLIATAAVGGSVNHKLLTDTAYDSSKLSIDGTASVDSTELWTFTGSNGSYTITQNNKYLNVNSDVVNVVDDAVQLTVTRATGSADSYGNTYTGWSIGNTVDGTTYYVNNFDLAGTNAGEWTGLDSGSIWMIYEIVESAGPASTTVTFTGVGKGETTAIVGNYKYNITVTEAPDLEPETVDVILEVDETKTLYIDGAAYDYARVTSADIATVTATGIDGVYARGEEVTTLDALVDGSYMIVGVHNDHCLTNTASDARLALSAYTSDSVDPTAVWNITVIDGQYYVQDANGNYLIINNEGATVGDQAAVEFVRESDHWKLRVVNPEDESQYTYLNDHDEGGDGPDGTAAGGWPNPSDAQLTGASALRWKIYKVDDLTQTTVKITGNAVGTTTATVGHVTYNISVYGDVKDVYIPVGGTWSEINAAANADHSNDIASLSVTSVTKYTASGAFLDTTGTAASTAAIESLEYTFTRNADGTYTIKDSSNTYYLDAYGVNRTDAHTEALSMDSDGTVYINSTGGEQYLCVDREGDTAWQFSPGTLTDDKAACSFFLYAPVSNDAESSEEIPGYKKLTSLDQIVSGEGYLVVFKGNDDQYYCVCYNADNNGTYTPYANTARVVKTDTGTTFNKVTITGIAPGNTVFTFGNALAYNVTVYTPGETGATNIVGTASYAHSNGTVDMTGQKVTALTLSEGAAFQVGIDIDDADSVVWFVEDTSIAGVDQYGNVTAVAPGDTTLSAAVYKDGVCEVISIPVHVTQSFVTDGTAAENVKPILWYIEQVDNTHPYYTLYSNSGLVERAKPVIEGQVIYIERSTDVGLAMIWTSAPEDGYALTFMAATDTLGHYHPLHINGTLESTETDYYTAGTTPYSNVLGVYNNADEIKGMLQTGINEYGWDGAMSMVRPVNNEESGATSLTFISDKLPEVEKTVTGVLGSSLTQSDWAPYENGMYAEVGEVVFFQITVTMERPKVWAENSTTNPALTFSDATLADIMGVDGTADGVTRDAYFYTKAADEADGVYDGKISAENRALAAPDVLTALRAEWAEDETQRVLTYNVAYVIQQEDTNKLLNNKADLSVTYSSAYSSGSKTTPATADVDLHVLGESLGDVILDFGLPVTIPNLTHDHLIDECSQEAIDKAKVEDQIHCWYGKVTINQPATEDDPTTTQIDETKWSVTYTPNQVFTGYDVVYLLDAAGNLKNFFRVYPASTVYYEESFAEYGTASQEANAAHGWTGHDSPITGNAQVMFRDKDGTVYTISNFGYTNKYAAETGMSNGTQAVSTKSGDTATFTFNGTGFDVYANCDPDTSVMAVLVYRVNFTTADQGQTTETLQKFYQVVTANKSGSTGATDGQDITANALPLVSVTDLEYGTYKVIIRHTKPLNDTTAQIRLDGFRVYNTLRDGDQYYPVDEQNAVFTELRDEVLTPYTGVTADTTIDQIFGKNDDAEGTEYPVTGTTVAYISADDSAEDLLENGPKNEIWMTAGNTLSFVLKDDIAYAQIGLKAPTGYAAFSITTTDANGATLGSATYNTNDSTANASITTATDMFYDIPGVAGGATVVITVLDDYTDTEGNIYKSLLSVTKLKTSPASDSGESPLAVMSEDQVDSVLDVIFDRNDGLDNVKSSVTRIYGANRYETALKAADELKLVLGVEKFDNIIIASGAGFADALSGSYLASVKNAPILLSGDSASNQMLSQYIAENLAENGVVYILGGSAAVAETVDEALIADGVTVKRLAGKNRYDTNLAILTEAGVENEEILVCTGSNFADSLSASAVGKPILLAHNESGKLTVEQAAYLDQLEGCTFTVIGGEAAVSAELEAAVAVYGATRRIYGADRYETSVEIAKNYMTEPKTVVLAYAGNYPDGLCGGVLAHALQAPLVLTMTGYETEAQQYVDAVMAKNGVILGGSSLISDNSVVNIFNLTDALEIITK